MWSVYLIKALINARIMDQRLKNSGGNDRQVDNRELFFSQGVQNMNQAERNAKIDSTHRLLISANCYRLADPVPTIRQNP